MELDNRITFWFDQSKPRVYDDLDKAINRYEEMSGKKYWRSTKQKKGKPRARVKANKKGSWHHVDNDRSNGHWMNLFWTEHDQQHSNLHNQLHQAASELIKSGVLGFDWKDKKYFVAWKPLADWLRNWRAKGEPNWHHNEGYRSKDREFLVQMHEALFESKKTQSPQTNAGS